jgi:hypothetical protein
MNRERLERRVTALAENRGCKRRATPCSYGLAKRVRALSGDERWNRRVIAGSDERHNNQMQRTSGGPDLEVARTEAAGCGCAHLHLVAARS